MFKCLSLRHHATYPARYLLRSERIKAKRRLVRVLVWSLVGFCLLTFLVGRLVRIIQLQRGETMVLSERLTAYQDQLQQTRNENAMLMSRVTTMPVDTDPQTRNIVEYYLAKYFGDKAPTAEKVFSCESGLRSAALNDKNIDHSTDRGISQINSVHATQFKAVTGADYSWGAHDIGLNIMFAKWIYDHSGSFSPWVCSRIIGALR